MGGSWRVTVWAMLAWACGLAQAQGATAPAAAVVGTWRNPVSHERLVFEPGGRLWTCFDPGARGNAALGVWSRQPKGGGYRVELTHATQSSCSGERQLRRRYQVPIVGAARLNNGQVALYVSGEGPPDLYKRWSNDSH